VTDDMFLACALASRAEFLITRDPDLLAMGKPFGIRIVTDDQFLKVAPEL
jgi:predicted nucleic acid-binding protein